MVSFCELIIVVHKWQGACTCTCTWQLDNHVHMHVYMPYSWKFSPGKNFLFSLPALMQNFYPANVLPHIHDYIRAYGDLCHRGESLFYWRFLYKCEGSWAGQNFCPAKFYLYSVVAFLCTLCCMMLYCGVSVALYIHTGHTLGTSLFSPPPSSTSQHGIFVNSPTTTGKVAFPSVFHAVGSGLYRSSSCGWGFPVCNIACVV